MQNRLLKSLLCSGLLWLNLPLWAQEDNSLQKARLDDAHWSNARAAALSNAVTPIAGGMDAFFYNPAGIGGLYTKKKRPLINQLHFPYFGLSVNEDSVKLNQQLRNGGDLEDQAVIDGIFENFTDERQYARASIVPNIVLGRLFLGYIIDKQVAAVSPDGTGDSIDIISRDDSGPALGFSLISPKRDIYLGVSLAYIERTQVEGTYTFEQLNEASERKSNLKDNRTKYEATPIHAGFIWQINQSWRPALSLAVRHAGGTRYRTREEGKDNLKTEEDLTLAFSLSPNTGSWGYLNTIFEAGRLTDGDTNLGKKIRFGLEWTVGDRFGSDAGFSLRAGYNSAGASYGLGTNVGIISLNAGSFAEDVGIANKQVLERRNVVDFAINVAAF